MAKKRRTIIEYRNYFLPLDFPVLLLSGDYWRISEKPSGRHHFHNCLEIGICHSDGGTLEVYDRQLGFMNGDITCIPRNIPHTTYSNPGTESHWSYLFLDTQNMFHRLLPEAWQNYDLSITSLNDYHFVLGKDEYSEIHEIANLIISELKEQKTGYRLSVRGLLLSLYIMLYRIQTISLRKEKETEQSRGNALAIAPALDYIEQNYEQAVEVDTLAKLCGWSLTHFRRIFREIMGISPLEHMNNVRIMEACVLLRSTEDTILDISESVGFHSVSSFNRFFFRIMQTTPREYRKHMALADRHMEKQSILEYAGWLYPEKL